MARPCIILEARASRPDARYTRAVIFLIRHGETVGNASRIVQRPDSPLSPRGIAQAERLARRLAREGVARIFSSDLARAMTTAEALQRASGAPLSFDPVLHERNFGDIRGTPYADLGFDMFEPDYAPPNGESWPVFHASRRPGVGARASAGGGDRPATWRWSPTASCAVPSPPATSCSPPAPRCRSAGRTPRSRSWTSAEPWRVHLLNCIAHLEDLDGAPLADAGAV